MASPAKFFLGLPVFFLRRGFTRAFGISGDEYRGVLFNQMVFKDYDNKQYGSVQDFQLHPMAAVAFATAKKTTECKQRWTVAKANGPSTCRRTRLCFRIFQ